MKYQSQFNSKTLLDLLYEENKNYQVKVFDRLFACLLMVVLAPVYLFNGLSAFINKSDICLTVQKQDALGRTVTLHYFTHGMLVKSAVLADILRGHISFCGVSLSHHLLIEEKDELLNNYRCAPGIFSLYDLRQSTGINVDNAKALLETQLQANFLQQVSLFIKSVFCLCFYSNAKKALLRPVTLPLFGLNINNATIVEAADWVTSSEDKSKTQLGFYVNAHSINVGVKDTSFIETLQQADALFADGSGMRIAAKSAGYLLKDNNNGTDMLPYICKNCVQHNKSLYLLGAAPGVAEKAAANLKKTYPGLVIAGFENGYAKQDNPEALVAQINESGCDVLLVAMGSPLQESWLLKHRDHLQCQTALAVGGLFDFYSEQISRSPLWLRELGMEWVWRLCKEPKNKFSRYVLGNPLFLYRIYFCNLVIKGVK